jgi:hypothetical protein
LADIRKNLILSAKLEDAQLKKQLEILKKELGKSFSVDAGSLNDLKSSIRDIAKEFGSQLKKELDGIRSPNNKAGTGQASSSNSSPNVNMSGIGSIQVKDMTVTNLVVQNMIGGAAASGQAPGGGGSPSQSGGPPSQGSGGGGFLSSNRGFLRALGAGVAIQQGVSSFVDIQQMLAERSNRFSRDLDSGSGVEAISREAGRQKLGLATTAGVGGALAGGYLGMKGGAALGTAFGPLGTVAGGWIGALGGAAIGGARAFLGTSNAVGELSKEETQLLSDAELRALAISPMRQQLMAGGGISTGTMTDQMQVGARGYGMSPQETLQAMLQARQFLGNQGASENFDNIMGNQRFLGIEAGTTAGAIETFAGAGGTSRAAAGQAQADIIKKGVAAGLDLSKSGKMLQTMDQFVQNAVGFGRLDTDQAGTQVASFAKGFAGGGPVTDIALRQAQNYADVIRQQSSSTQGLAGAANIMGLQEIGASFGGFGIGTLLALAKLQSNPTEEDVLSVLSEGQRTGEVSKNADLASAVKQVQKLKSEDQAALFIEDKLGKNLGGAFLAEERGGTMQDVLGQRRAREGGLTAADLAGAGGQIGAARGGVQASSEYKLDVALFTRSAEQAGKGLETFGSITNRLVEQMTTMLSDLKVAQGKFNSNAESIGYGSGASQPNRMPGR